MQCLVFEVFSSFKSLTIECLTRINFKIVMNKVIFGFRIEHVRVEIKATSFHYNLENLTNEKV